MPNGKKSYARAVSRASGRKARQGFRTNSRQSRTLACYRCAGCGKGACSRSEKKFDSALAGQVSISLFAKDAARLEEDRPFFTCVTRGLRGLWGHLGTSSMMVQADTAYAPA